VAYLIVKINGALVNFVNESVTIEDTIGERSTVSFVVWDEAGTRHYQKGEPYEIYDNDGELIISGVIEDSKEQACGPVDPGMLHEITGADNHYFADKRIVAKSYTNMTAGAIVRELIKSYLSAEGISGGAIQDGPVVSEAVFNYIPVTDCLDSLAEKAGFWWNIDSQKQLYFVARQTYAAPWELNSMDILDEPEITQGNPQYRNKQYIIGGKDITDTLTEVMVGDGQSRSFTVGFAIAQEPAIAVNRGAGWVNIPPAGVGIKGKDRDKQWYWSKGDPVVVQDDQESVLGTSDQVQITYRGEFPIVAIYAYAPEVNRLRALEGNGTGLVESVEDEETNCKNAALQSATAKIQQYAADGKKLQFKTDRKGLKPGQLITVNLPKYGLNRIEMLIQAVQVQDDVTRLIYDVTAVEGPVDESWTKFFYSLVTAKQQVIRENISEDEILVILEQYSKTWLQEDSNNIFRTCYPAGGFYPGVNLYPQFGAKDRVKYVALLDTANQEIGRFEPIQQSGCDTNNISSTFYILPNYGVGSIAKLAWYGGTSASLYPGSGVKLAEVSYAHNKTNIESIQIERTDMKGW
jgi:hypothetical protein